MLDHSIGLTERSNTLSMLNNRHLTMCQLALTALRVEDHEASVAKTMCGLYGTRQTLVTQRDNVCMASTVH